MTDVSIPQTVSECNGDSTIWTAVPVQVRDVASLGAIQTINARDLHAFLGVGKVFGAWIQERIEQYGFIENQDFAVFSDSGKNLKGGRPAKEYALALDMAKELAMVERNEKGRQARRYFIECERLAKHAPLSSVTPKEVGGIVKGVIDKRARAWEAMLAETLGRLSAATEGVSYSKKLAVIREARLSGVPKSQLQALWVRLGLPSTDGMVHAAALAPQGDLFTDRPRGSA